MALVHMDVYSSSGTSLEGYNHAVIVTDSRSEHRWHSLAVWNEYKGRSLGNVKEMPVGGRNGRHPEGSSDFGCGQLVVCDNAGENRQSSEWLKHVAHNLI